MKIFPWHTYPCGCRIAAISDADVPAACPTHGEISAFAAFDYTITSEDRMFLFALGARVTGKSWRD